jgi:hypothetical protein
MAGDARPGFAPGSILALRRKAAYIQGMARFSVIRLAVAGAILSVALPAASYAATPDIGPRPSHPVTPNDTLSKLEKPKSERSTPTPAPKKKLKPGQATPSPLSPHSLYLPDQPWETEFYVENDISGRRAGQLALASFNPRH